MIWVNATRSDKSGHGGSTDTRSASETSPEVAESHALIVVQVRSGRPRSRLQDGDRLAIRAACDTTIGMRIGPRPKDRAPFIGQRRIADLPRGEISFQRRYNIMNFIR